MFLIKKGQNNVIKTNIEGGITTPLLLILKSQETAQKFAIKIVLTSFNERAIVFSINEGSTYPKTNTTTNISLTYKTYEYTIYRANPSNFEPNGSPIKSGILRII